MASIPPSHGSYNSAPHFKNIEGHLDRLLIQSGERGPEPELVIPLSQLELYLLLASVLFHDVGRVRGDDNHSYASCELLDANFAELGIPSAELACSLGRIAIFHDPVKKRSEEELKTDLKEDIEQDGKVVSTHDRLERRRARRQRDKSDGERDRLSARERLVELQIEPFGRARELYVATLISLADHLDASVRRAEPTYVRPDDQISFKGAFRRVVLGSSYDRTTRSIKTCIHNPWERDKTATPSELKSVALYQIEHGFEWPGPKLEEARSKLNSAPAIYTAYFGSNTVIPCRKLFEMACSDQWRLKKEGVFSPWPADYTLARVLCDLGANKSYLEEVKTDLREMGLPVDDWLIEYKGFTYDETGAKKQEPVFSELPPDRILKTMTELSQSIFGRRSFSYEILADCLRVSDIEFVRLAVQRIKANFDEVSQTARRHNIELIIYPDSWELRQKN